MSDREYERIPYSMQVEFRTASSFLVAYSVNLSRGGMFIETDSEVPTGVLLALDLQVPGAGLLQLVGLVAWRRGVDSPDGPAGLGAGEGAQHQGALRLSRPSARFSPDFCQSPFR